MDEGTIRADVERRIGRQVTDGLWAFLLKHGYVDDVAREAREIDDLARVAREIWLAGLERPERVTKARGNMDAQAWARSILVAEIAREDPEVIAFRRDVLDDKLMAQGDVPNWVEQQEKNEIPVTWATVPIEGDQPLTEGMVTGRASGWSVRVLHYAGPDDKWVRLATTGRGVLERLRRISVSLADFYAWTEAQAVMFVLTDVLPWISPIRITEPGMKVRNNIGCTWAQRISLDIDPSVSPAEVAEIYKKIRNKHGRRRRISEKHAQLAIFGSEQPDSSWNELMAEWNRKHSNWAYAHVSNFRRDVRRAQAQAIGAVKPLAGW